MTLRSTSTGRHSVYDNAFRVEEYGEIKTKAGPFKAFKISWSQLNRHRGSRSWATLWYSPEVKAVVKREAHTAGWFIDRELESYTLKQR